MRKWALRMAVVLIVAVVACAKEKSGEGARGLASPKRVPQAGHIIADSVRALQISRRGDRVAGIVDGDLRLYTSRGEEVSRFKAPEESRFERFFAAPDFSWFVAMSLSPTGPALHFLDERLSEVNRVRFNEDTLLTVNEIPPQGDRVNLWTVESTGLAADFRKLRELERSEDPEAQQEARQLVAKMKRKFVIQRWAYDRHGQAIWDLRVGEAVIDLTGQSSPPTLPGPVAHSPDGKYYFSPGTPGMENDPENTVYDARTGQALFRIPLRENEVVFPTLAPSEVGLFVFSIFKSEDPASASFKVSRWDLTGNRIWEKDIPNLLEYANTAADGKRIVMLTSPPGKPSEKVILVWDESGNEAGARTLDPRAELGKDYRISETVSVSLSEDGRYLMYCAVYIAPSVFGEQAKPLGSVQGQGFFQCRVYDTETGQIVFKTQSVNLQDGSRYRAVFGRTGLALAQIRYPPPPPQPSEQKSPWVIPEAPRETTVTIYTY